MILKLDSYLMDRSLGSNPLLPISTQPSLANSATIANKTQLFDKRNVIRVYQYQLYLCKNRIT